MFKLSILIASGVSLAALAQPAQAQRAGDKIADSYICVFERGSVSRGNAQAEANRAAQAVGAQISHVYSVAIQGFAARMNAQGAERIRAANPNIAYCEQDQVVTHGPIQAAGQPISARPFSPRRRRPGASRASMAASPAPSPRRG